MGYFSNGTEGAAYQWRYCQHCVHDLNHDCPVWMLHLIHNYDGDKGDLLNELIPRSEDGLYNEQCRLYHPATEVERMRAEGQPELFEAQTAGKPAA